MFANSTKSLHCDACTIKLDAQLVFGNVRTCDNAVGGRTNFVQRNSAKDFRQSDAASALVPDKRHGSFVGAHVGTGNVIR